MPQFTHVVPANLRPLLAGDAAPPDRVGPYKLLLPIASGGMATVFLARKRGAGGFERMVALKLTHAHLRNEPGWAEDLVEEAKLAARIRHPNVVQVLDVEDDAAGVFLVMEYVEGSTLAALMRHAQRTKERVPIDVALRVLCDALAGLHAAHELRDDGGQLVGLVHRDFTPHNVLVGLDGVARLTDFGVAKAAIRVSVTTTGIVKGKAGYMPPEQVRGEPLDRRSDVWAAGVVAWELLAGRRLHKAGIDPVAMLLSAATRAPDRLRDVRLDIPAALDETVASALLLDRTRRWPTAAAFCERLIATCGVPLADPAIVADFVDMVVGGELATRRAQVAELDRLAPSSRAQAPREDVSSPPELATEPGAPPAEALDALPLLEPRVVAAPAPSRVRRAAALLAAGLIGASLTAALVLRGGARVTPSAAALPAPAALVAPATATAGSPSDEPPLAAIAPGTSSASSDLAATPQASASAEPSGRGGRAAGARGRPRVATPSPPKGSGDRPLAASPYE